MLQLGSKTGRKKVTTTTTTMTTTRENTELSTRPIMSIHKSWFQQDRKCYCGCMCECIRVCVCVCSVYFLPFTFLVIRSFLLGFSNWKWAMFWPIASSFRTKTFNFKLLEFSLFGLYFMAFAINQPLRTMFLTSISLSLFHSLVIAKLYRWLESQNRVRCESSTTSNVLCHFQSY